MTRYHLTPKGEAKVCQADHGKCPYGDERAHYDSTGEAENSFALKMKDHLIPTPAQRTVPWEEMSWPERKQSLEELAATIAHRYNLKGVTVQWKQTPKSASGVGVWGLMNTRTKVLTLAEEMQCFNEAEARENVIHELAHLIVDSPQAKKKRGNRKVNHGEEWIAKCEEIAQDIPGMKYHVFQESTVVSPETALKLASWTTALHKTLWFADCPHCHRRYATGYGPPHPSHCQYCRWGEYVFPTPRKNRGLEWEQRNLS